ncbi:hypothetical protein [Bacillus sp. Marseille-Q3570]|uniref:hypothetical protein n=1 Tax=Bacillus sp. Marseille-Q3570 TaxID=2963522 RepID=UPI0021B7177B|nr:hypothetical protein [Bacillus sp. Marseille-Q3570]
MVNKRLIRMIGIFIAVALAFWGYTYFQNSTIEKVLEGKDVLDVVPISTNDHLVIYQSDQMIHGDHYSKGLLGWKLDGTSAPAIMNRAEDTIFRIDNFSVIEIGNKGFLYGYADPMKIKQIKFQNGDFSIRTNVDSSYWYLPMLSEETSFNAGQLSVILDDGTEVFYPFDGLE